MPSSLAVTKRCASSAQRMSRLSRRRSSADLLKRRKTLMLVVLGVIAGAQPTRARGSICLVINFVVGQRLLGSAMRGPRMRERSAGAPDRVASVGVLTEMRIVSLIDEEDVIERILRHLGLWQEGGACISGTDPPGETTLDPWLDDPFPDYDTEPVVAFSAT